MTALRSIDVLLPASEQPESRIDTTRLPLCCHMIPPSVGSLSECALNEVKSLINKKSLSQEEEDSLDDGFVLCDLNVVRRKLEIWYRLFPRVKPFFAVKCNPDSMVASVLGQQSDQVGFDCASLPEIKLALGSTNDNARRCIYANPQRAEADLESALELKVDALTFDGPEELKKVHRAYKKRCNGTANDPLPPEMVLRILVPDATSSIPLGEKFGVPPSLVDSLVKEAVTLGLPIIGVSFHCGSGCHDAQAYVNAIRLAKEAMDKINQIQSDPPCRLLDIGGGFPGFDGAGGDEGRFCGRIQQGIPLQHRDDSSTSTIAALVTPLLEELFPPNESPIQVIAEPGRYFVEAAFAVCSRIYSVRVVEKEGIVHRHYYIAQGVHGVFKDVLLCHENFVPIPLKLRDQATDETCRSTVHGPSGEPYDVVCRDYDLPPMQVGDFLIFDRMGAYTLSIAARSGRPPVRYVMGRP